MPHVLVRNVPDDVHAALQRKAEHHHQSLQQYLAVELRHLAERRSISEVLDEVEVQPGGQGRFRAGGRAPLALAGQRPLGGRGDHPAGRVHAARLHAG